MCDDDDFAIRNMFDALDFHGMPTIFEWPLVSVAYQFFTKAASCGDHWMAKRSVLVIVILGG